MHMDSLIPVLNVVFNLSPIFQLLSIVDNPQQKPYNLSLPATTSNVLNSFLYVYHSLSEASVCLPNIVSIFFNLVVSSYLYLLYFKRRPTPQSSTLPPISSPIHSQSYQYVQSPNCYSQIYSPHTIDSDQLLFNIDDLIQQQQQQHQQHPQLQQQQQHHLPHQPPNTKSPGSSLGSLIPINAPILATLLALSPVPSNASPIYPQNVLVSAKNVSWLPIINFVLLLITKINLLYSFFDTSIFSIKSLRYSFIGFLIESIAIFSYFMLSFFNITNDIALLFHQCWGLMFILLLNILLLVSILCYIDKVMRLTNHSTNPYPNHNKYTEPNYSSIS